MIKYINRIIYAMLAGIGLLLIFNLSQSYVITNFLIEEGQKALDEHNDAYFMPTRFYNEIPVTDFDYNHDAYVFNVKIYEVAYVTMNDDDTLEAIDGIFLFLEQISGPDLDDVFEVEFVSLSQTITYTGRKQLTLPLYTTFEPDTNRTIVLKEAFYINGDYEFLTSIRIYQADTLTFDIAVNIDFNQFMIKDEINGYLNTHDSAPTEAFDHVSVTPYVEVVDEGHIVARNMIIYTVMITGLTYVMFKYRKNKRLGKKEATPGLKEDIQKLHDEEDIQ